MGPWNFSMNTMIYHSTKISKDYPISWGNRRATAGFSVEEWRCHWLVVSAYFSMFQRFRKGCGLSGSIITDLVRWTMNRNIKIMLSLCRSTFLQPINKAFQFPWLWPTTGLAKTLKFSAASISEGWLSSTDQSISLPASIGPLVHAQWISSV